MTKISRLFKKAELTPERLYDEFQDRCKFAKRIPPIEIIHEWYFQGYPGTNKYFNNKLYEICRDWIGLDFKITDIITKRKK